MRYWAARSRLFRGGMEMATSLLESIANNEIVIDNAYQVVFMVLGEEVRNCGQDLNLLFLRAKVDSSAKKTASRISQDEAYTSTFSLRIAMKRPCFRDSKRATGKNTERGNPIFDDEETLSPIRTISRLSTAYVAGRTPVIAVCEAQRC